MGRGGKVSHQTTRPKAIRPSQKPAGVTQLKQAFSTVLPAGLAPRQGPAPHGADLAMNFCNRHKSAAPFPANGTAHASNAKVLLGRGRLTNEKSEAIFAFGRRV